MPVLLHRARDLPPRERYDRWARIPGTDDAEPDPAMELVDLPHALEEAFDCTGADWWAVGRVLGAEPSARLAHAPACAPNASDLGLMMAWSRLVASWAAETSHTLVLCDDPWVFRHLRALPGVSAGKAPGLAGASCRLHLRGLLARSRAALRYASWAVRLRRARATPATGAPSLLVYGHPASTADGIDGYFGDLMRRIPTLRRMLHVDCPPGRAEALAADGRTDSLHGFGNPFYAALLPFLRWRPQRDRRRGPHGWLVRRAAAREGGTGTAAAIAWQIHCQRRWLRRCRPAAVAWPWENHSWERDFVRAARHCGTRTLGYQHSVIGRQMLNYAPASNPDGAASLPDLIACNGGTTRAQLRQWGVPEERLAMGGALRFVSQLAPARDDAAPIFLALPFDGGTAGEMVAAAREAAKHGHRFVVKDHPMTPFAFEDTPGVRRTAEPLSRQPAVAAVVYAATTVGLEAILAGLPTLRFRPRARIAIDILPAGLAAPTVEATTLGKMLKAPPLPPAVAAGDIFAPVDEAFWRKAFETTPQG